MTTRLEYWKAAPEAERHLASLYGYIARSGLDSRLVWLVYLRVSQLNGCAFCVDLHFREATSAGEEPRRLNAVAAWREAPFFSPRERAALEWAESLTLLGDGVTGAGAYAAVREHFDDRALADLTYAIGTMNAYNRLAIGFRRRPEGRS